jgi:hypothetical protein
MKPPRHALRTPPPSPHATAVSARHRRLRCRPDVVCCASSPPSFAAHCLRCHSLHAAARNRTARPSARRRRLHCRPGVVCCASSLPSFAARRRTPHRSLHVASVVVRCTPPHSAAPHAPPHTAAVVSAAAPASFAARRLSRRSLHATIRPSTRRRFVATAGSIVHRDEGGRSNQQLSSQPYHIVLYYKLPR